MGIFESRSRPGWHHPFTMILRECAFLALGRFVGKEGPPPTVGQITPAIAMERVAQLLMRDRGPYWKRAKAYALSVLKRVMHG